jgi:hypothetical protein
MLWELMTRFLTNNPKVTYTKFGNRSRCEQPGSPTTCGQLSETDGFAKYIFEIVTELREKGRGTT